MTYARIAKVPGRGERAGAWIKQLNIGDGFAGGVRAARDEHHSDVEKRGVSQRQFCSDS